MIDNAVAMALVIMMRGKLYKYAMFSCEFSEAETIIYHLNSKEWMQKMEKSKTHQLLTIYYNQLRLEPDNRPSSLFELISKKHFCCLQLKKEHILALLEALSDDEDYELDDNKHAQQQLLPKEKRDPKVCTDKQYNFLMELSREARDTAKLKALTLDQKIEKAIKLANIMEIGDANKIIRTHNMDKKTSSDIDPDALSRLFEIISEHYEVMINHNIHIIQNFEHILQRMIEGDDVGYLYVDSSIFTSETHHKNWLKRIIYRLKKYIPI